MITPDPPANFLSPTHVASYSTPSGLTPSQAPPQQPPTIELQQQTRSIKPQHPVNNDPLLSNNSRRSMIASKRVGDSSNLSRKGAHGNFFTNLMSTTVPIDKLPKLPPPLRIAIVGAAKSGKTQIIQRFINGQYERNYVPTNKIELSLKLLQTSLGHSYALELWDIPAHSKMEDLLKDSYLQQMDGAMIVTDSTDLKSFGMIRKWADLFNEIQLARLAENLTALGINDEDATSVSGQLAHSLPGPDGRPLLVSTFPVLLFANKSDSDKCTLTRQDILESASHFKLSFGVLGSALFNKPLNVPPLTVSTSVGPSILSIMGELNRLNPADTGIDHAFQLLLSELIKFQHLRATTALAHVSLGPQGNSIVRTELPLPSGTLLLENSLHSLAQNSRGGMNLFSQSQGLASRKFLASHGPSVPLPSALKIVTSTIGSGKASAFNFNSRLKNTTPTATSGNIQPKSNVLAAAALNQARSAKIAAEEDELGLGSNSQFHLARRHRKHPADDDDEDEEDLDSDDDDGGSGSSSVAEDGDDIHEEEPEAILSGEEEEEDHQEASTERVLSLPPVPGPQIVEEEEEQPQPILNQPNFEEAVNEVVQEEEVQHVEEEVVADEPQPQEVQEEQEEQPQQVLDEEQPQVEQQQIEEEQVQEQEQHIADEEVPTESQHEEFQPEVEEEAAQPLLSPIESPQEEEVQMVEEDEVVQEEEQQNHEEEAVPEQQQEEVVEEEQVVQDQPEQDDEAQSIMNEEVIQAAEDGEQQQIESTETEEEQQQQMQEQAQEGE